MFFFDLFIDFIHKHHSLIIKLFIYLLYTVIGFFIIIVGILYINTGEIILDRHILLSSKIYTALFDNHRNTIYILIALEQFIFIGILLWQNYQLKNNSIHPVKYIHIKDIANIWLQDQQIKENIKNMNENDLHQIKSPNIDIQNAKISTKSELK